MKFKELQPNLPVEFLPDDLQVLFDPSPSHRALPPDVWFLPYDTDYFFFNAAIFGLLVGGCFGVSGIFGIIVMTVSILNGSYAITEPADIIVYIVVYLVLAGLVAIAWFNFWKPLWYDYLAWQEKRAGLLRRGLFLTSEAMIVRMKTNYCDVLPRDAITDAKLLGYRRPTLYVLYNTLDGKAKSYDLAGAVSWGNINHRYALSHVREWAGLDTKTKKAKRG
ncbi:MAG TPA: hypothetical protein VHL11_10135 [Phototrophicaceae bacterium]|jgi:hypothetical protein|nr:hypothetical protein [Phototrophicaceae bacterium]